MSHRNLSRLRERDESWDYRGESTKSTTHGLHGYPAMMIPQIAERLIHEFSRPGDTILDPFCGSGSVLVEAALSGRSAWGIDLNPLAALIARVKTTPAGPTELSRRLDQLLAAARDLRATPPPPPSIPRLDYWFKPAVIGDLSVLRALVGDILSTTEREFFQVAFSATVREASNTRAAEFKLYRYDAERLATHQPDALAIFERRSRDNIRRLSEFTRRRPPAVWTRVLLGDSRARRPEIAAGSVAAVVTSPPYGDSRTTVAYGQYSRLSAAWLDLGEPGHRDLDNRLLGGSARRVLAVPHHSPTLQKAISYIDEAHAGRAREVLAFFVDFNQCLERLAEYLRPGGVACLVVGNRRVKGRELPTDIIICELAETLGLDPVRIIVREIPSKRMPHRNSPSNVPGETDQTMLHERIIILRHPA